MMDGEESSVTVPLTIEQQFEQYKEKTKKWKQAVKLQLEDAAAKNSSLRDDLKRALSERDAMMAQLRLDLNAEFTDRTQSKDAAIESLNKEVSRLRDAHRSELDSLREQLRAQYEQQLKEALADKEYEFGNVQKQHAAQVSNIQEEVNRGARALENARHELAVSQARTAQLKAQNEELTKQQTDKDNGEETRVTQVHVMAAKEVESLKAQLELYTSKNASLVDQCEKLSKEHKDDLLRREEVYNDEIQRREERIIVLQTILKQAQKESNDMLIRWTAMQDEHHRTIERYMNDHEKLSTSNRALEAQYEELKKKHSVMETEWMRAVKTITELEESNAIRDRTFQELLMNEDQKLMIAHLEHRLNAATDEANDWREKYVVLNKTLDQQRSLLEQRERDLQEQESALAKRCANLSDKQQVLSNQEKKLREQHQLLSSQAAQLLGGTPNAGQNRGGLGEANGDPASSSSSLINFGHAPGESSGGSLQSFYQSLADSIGNIQQNYARAIARTNGSKRAAASLLFRHYRRLLPVVVIVLLLITVVYWWLFSGVGPASSGERSLVSFSDMNEELKAMKREYGLLVSKLQQCCPTEAIPPPIPELRLHKLV